jgi:hypothetical protein
MTYQPHQSEDLTAKPVADASQLKQPHWGHVMQAFVDGAREARANPDATEHDFGRAADGYTKRVFAEVDPAGDRYLNGA